jgi:hypothetical protein
LFLKPAKFEIRISPDFIKLVETNPNDQNIKFKTGKSWQNHFSPFLLMF